MSDYRVTGSWQRYQQLPIRALAQGGYERAGIPNPNSGMALFQSHSGITTPNVESLRRQADAADRFTLQRVQEQEAEERNDFMYDPLNPKGISGTFREARELGGQIQRQSNPEFDKWRLFGQVLKNMGVDHLQTDSAAGAKQGGGYDTRQIVDYGFNADGSRKPQVAGYSGGPNLRGDAPGFFDYNPHTSLAEAYQKNKDWAMSEEPRNRRDRTKGGYQAQETMSHNLYEQNALKQLRDWRLR